MFRDARGYGNPVLDEKFKFSAHLSHKNRVRNTPSTIATKSLDQQVIRKLNKDKAWTIEEFKILEIEVQNKKLFHKLQRINNTSVPPVHLEYDSRHEKMLTTRQHTRAKKMETIDKEN